LARYLLILFFLFLFSSCVSPQEQKDQGEFYQGLLLDSDSENITEKVRLFESALASPNVYVRQFAAEELAILMQHGTELSAKTMEQMRREASGLWAAAFDIAENELNRERVLSFLLSFEQNVVNSFSEARLYILNECEKQGLFFTENELAAIEAHYAVSRLRYNDALNFFRTFQVDGTAANNRWPAQMPELFFEYPNLINDLGRAFQFTQSGGEGLNLFLQWESALSDQTDDLRYRLVFYAARVARRMGQNAQAVQLFERALTLAPDYEQLDACIWYILDSSMSGPINVIMERLERLVPLMYSGSYFNSILERYLHRLVSAQDWGRVARTYDLLKDTNTVTKAGFAWVIARTIEQGYLSAADRQISARAANAEAALPDVFYQIAYNAGQSLVMPGLYYRMLGADALGLPLLTFLQEDIYCCYDNKPPASDALQFLLGFFDNDAVDLSVPYIRSFERTLNPCELRAVSQALAQAEMYPQSMRLVTLYIFREDYARQRRDLELMYPRPYLELIETQTLQFNIEPWLFFGLVRTESAFQNAVASRVGAVGLAQLMPATAREQAERIRREGGPDFLGSENTVDRTDPFTNLYIGTFYLNHWRNHFNNMVLALMSYNGGATRVRRWYTATNLPLDLFVETVPIYETRDYGRRVPAIGRIYEELYYR